MSGSVHGGAFWEVVEDDLPRLDSVVRADVLDAWFPPAPAVLEAMAEFRVEMCRTTPEAECRPLRAALSRAREIPEDCILCGAGSSALIYLALPALARSAKSARILDPMYGEYRHLLEGLGTTLVRMLRLERGDDYRLDPRRLLGCDDELVVPVNPNSPTGQHVQRRILLPIIEELARDRVLWIDETYIDYAGPGESLEDFAARNRNIILCKSMSKVYSLSGLRVAYLVSHPSRLAEFSGMMPPWAVSLPAQVCGALAVRECGYYSGRYAQTASLRQSLTAGLSGLGLAVTDGVINCVLVHLPPDGPTADEVRESCRKDGVYIRNAGSMGSSMGTHTLRISVRGCEDNERVVHAMAEALA